ncbi:MAG: non-canonical purine NTP pyrophosphatase [Acidobacteriota bacterium]
MDSAPFALVTGNINKIREAERILGFALESVKIDLPEIQSLDIAEVLEAKVLEAYRRARRPVVVEETGLTLDAMGGFPGPLIKWMLDAMGPEGVARTGHALGDPGASAVCALAYHDGHRTVTATGVTEGVLLEKPRGEHGFGWDPVFRPLESDLSFAELGPDDKDRIGHRGRGWRAFREALASSGVLVGTDEQSKEESDSARQI